MSNGSNKEPKFIKVHIDRKVYETKTPTTGRALYELGEIHNPRELFKEVPGSDEDVFVPNDDSEISLSQGEHFYSQKDFKIIVNGREKHATGPRLSYEEVVRLAYDQPPTGPNILFTITYRKGPQINPEGTLLEGQSVIIKNKMVFDVTTTDKS